MPENILPAHAHRHERHDEIVMVEMNVIHFLLLVRLFYAGAAKIMKIFRREQKSKKWHSGKDFVFSTNWYFTQLGVGSAIRNATVGQGAIRASKGSLMHKKHVVYKHAFGAKATQKRALFLFGGGSLRSTSGGLSSQRQGHRFAGLWLQTARRFRCHTKWHLRAP